MQITAAVVCAYLDYVMVVVRLGKMKTQGLQVINSVEHHIAVLVLAKSRGTRMHKTTIVQGREVVNQKIVCTFVKNQADMLLAQATSMKLQWSAEWITMDIKQNAMVITMVTMHISIVEKNAIALLQIRNNS